MTRFQAAPLVVLAALTMGCSKSDTAEPRVPAGTADQAPPPASPPASPNKTAPLPPPPPFPQAEPGVNTQGAATLEFKKRIDAYIKIHNEADAKVPSLRKTDDPKEISDREKALGEMIMTLRAGARPGEIFAPDYQPYFIRIVQDDFKQRSAEDRKALIVELPAKMKVDINTVYPTTIALATFPPLLLRKLPNLPPDLEYRIVGRSLILRDVKANLIVDILRDVVPTIPS
jgi:hypothetical protein